MKIIMKHYYKAKEFVLNQLKSIDDYSYEIVIPPNTLAHVKLPGKKEEIYKPGKYLL